MDYTCKIADVKEIIYLFYEEHKKPSSIANELCVSRPYITKTIKKDERYIAEKETGKNKNKETRKVKNRIAMQKKREKEREILEDMQLKHKQAVIELSKFSNYY